VGLSPGARLGPYEIVAAIGAGGMGEVYRARDRTLGRDVAIKVLSAAFASNVDRLARFEREARTLATLNHPNIAQIHGFENAPATGAEQAGVHALVMELVTGEDLSTLISRRPVPLAEALPIARQLADALEAAHDAGIVHRDLKPANVRVRDDGTVKVLDFGLAKALTGDPESVSGSRGMTMTSPAQTLHGEILGTAAYMSPEQARGRPVDKRADVWAFGVVLFEMLTGRPLFPGDTITDVLAAVVMREPDWTALPPDTPASITRLLRRCLEKDPSRRLRDAADARLEIDEAGRAGQDDGDARPGEGNAARRRQWPWLLAAAGTLTAGAAIGALMLAKPVTAELPLRVLNLTIPEASAPTAAISPDGRWVAAISEGQILVKGMDGSAWRELAGTAGARQPLIFSPDSRLIAFAVGNSIKKVDLVGSRPQVICDRCIQPFSLRGGSWNADGVLLLGGSPEDVKLGGGLIRIPESGGTMERVTTVDTARGENSHRYPMFLPDGRRFTFAVRRDNGDHEIRLGDLSGTPARTIASGFSKTLYADGYILFVRDETLLALAIDPATGQVSGDPVKVATGVSHNVGTALASMSVGREGTLAFGAAAATRGFAFYDRHGRKLTDVTSRASDAGGRLSPDGRRAAVAEIDPEKSSTDIYVVDLATGARTRLTSDPNWEQSPVWSPDGQRLAYRLGPAIYLQTIDGGKPQRISEFSTGAAGFVHDWSPDGKYLLLTRSSVAGGELARLSLQDLRIEAIAPSSAAEAGDARLSKDGRWVAYLSTETGATEVHIRSFPDGRVTHRVTTSGGDAPLWRRDGKELFYRDHEGWVVACAVRATAAAIETGPPERLFKPSIANSWGSGYQQDIHADGRFFVYRVGDETGSFANTLTVMLNWTKAIARDPK
jgi:WD40 repeat protein